MRTSEAVLAFGRYLQFRGLALSKLSAEQAVDAAVAFFESVRATDVESEFGDMLLFQWGTCDWRDGNGPSFQFELARQFSVAGFDSEEADDALWQLRLTLHYPPSEVTAAVGAGERWCENMSDVADFRTFIQTTPAMALAAAADPDRVELTLDPAG